jgi:hypothetical protein
VDDIWLALYWTGPVGVGVFLAGLGVLLWGISRLQGKEKRRSDG